MAACSLMLIGMLTLGALGALASGKIEKRFDMIDQEMSGWKVRRGAVRVANASELLTQKRFDMIDNTHGGWKRSAPEQVRRNHAKVLPFYFGSAHRNAST